MDDNSLESIRLLDSTVVEERLQAVRSLPDQSPLRMDLFCRVFGDQDWRVRKEAVRVFLAVPGVQDQVAEIINLLYDAENAGLRNSSIEILVSLGPLAVNDLADNISCNDPEVRKFIIDILGEIGHPECADKIIEALADEDTNVRYAAVETLGKLAREEAVSPLLDLMESADTGLQFTTLEALSLIGGDVPVERLSRFLGDPVLRKAVLDCFGRIGGAEVLPYLVEGLDDPMRKVRKASLKSLGRLVITLPGEVRTVLRAVSDNLADRLIDLLNDSDPDAQQVAIRLAAQSDSERVARSLLPLLENDLLRDEVIAAFRALDVDVFIKLLDSAQRADPMTRLYLIFLSGELTCAEGLSLAADSLDSPDPQQRYSAVVTLGKIGHESAIGPLVERLKDENPDICDAAAAALELFSSEHSHTIAASVSPLLALPEAALRMRAVRVLSAVGGHEVESTLLMALKDVDPEVRCEAIKALRGSSSSAYIEGLKLALNDEITDVRRLSVEALGACPENQALSALNLAVEDQDPWVRAAAVKSLLTFSAGEADRILSTATGDTVGLVVIAALETLLERDYASALPFLEQALRHVDEEVVKAAIDLLVRSWGSGDLRDRGPELLGHPLQNVRTHSISLFARLCGKDCLPHLEQRLQVEQEPMVRQVLEETVQRLLRSGS